MSDMSTGLALGGGAAKGFIHVGVIKYLQEHDMPIHAIAGTSMGAIIGAMLAKNMTHQNIYDVLHSLKYTDLLDIDISHGLIKGDKLMKKIKQHLGDISFEELSIPLTITATNMHTGEETIFRSGSVLEALRCSISLPGIFTLATHSQYKNTYYVDGGLTNNLPASHLDTERIIAVSCQGLGDFVAKDSQEILGKKFDTTWLTLPKRVIYRSLNIMMTQIENHALEGHQNITLLRPDLSHISAFDLDVLDKAMEIGYIHAKEML